MSESPLPRIAAIGLVIGASLGMAGTFVSSASLRSLMWGLDGTALTVSAALLTVHHLRRGNDMVAAGFLVFATGQSLILSIAAMNLVAGSPTFGAGVGLWSVSLALVSSAGIMPKWVRAVGVAGSVLFAIVAVQIFVGSPITPLSEPLPFFAYPFLAATLFGWAWAHYR